MAGIETRIDTERASREGESRLLRIVGAAPADRGRGRRGRRAPLAAVAVFAALAVLVFRGEGSGSTGGDRATLEYRYDGPSWVDPVLLGAAAALVLIAILLWAARRPAIAALAVLLLPCIVAGAVVSAVTKRTAGRVGPAEVRAASKQGTESGVRDLLGPPAGHGTMHDRSGRAECLVYVGDAEDPSGWRAQHFFCFRDGRLVARRSL